MMTNLFKSMNLIRRGSGTNLNLFRYAAMVIMLLTLGIGNAWGSTSNYYSKVTLSKNTAAAGKVYAQKDGTNGTWTENTKTSAADAQYSEPTHTWYIKAEPANGYVFKNWTSMSGWKSGNSPSATANPANGKITGKTSAASAEGKATANFEEITINAGSSTTPVVFENNSVSCTDNTGTITFPTNGDAKTDFAAPTFVNTGHGTFSVTSWDVDASTGSVTVNYKFVGDNTYGGASGTRSRSTTGVVTLKTCVGNNTNLCTIIASFPNITIAAGEGTSFNATLNEEKQSAATFAVEYADDADDFTAEFSDETTGSTWGVDDISYADGVVTVTYTFNSTVADTHTATLTLTANGNAGGASNTAELTAISKAKASDDASVTYNNTTTNYSTIAAAISAANSQPGAVVTLLRNIPSETTPSLSSPIEITGLMTLDLNSYTIARTGMADGSQQVITVNMSNAASVLTIKDSSVGHDGKISGTGGSNGNMLYAVCMEKGVLNFESGIVECTNTNSGDNAKATGIRVKNGCKLLMQGGTINATTSGNPARGIYATTTSSNAQMVVVSGGFINTKAANSSVGIDCESTDTPSSIDPDPTKANVILSGVIVDAQTTGTTEAIAVRSGSGVILGIQNGSYTATSKTTTAYAVQSSGHTAILGGTFNANATTNLAHAMRVEKGITAVKGGTFTATAEQKTAHGAYICDGAKLLTYGGTFKGVVNAMVVDGWVTGTQVYDGGTLEAQGGTFIGEANNLNQSSEIAVCAAGIYLNNSSKASYATISNATLQGKINNANLKGADKDTYRGAHGLMTRTTSPVTLTNCSISANTAHKYAFGIRSMNTSVELKNCAVTVNSSKDYNYGIYTYGTAKVEAYNSTITCISQTLYAYGAYVANGSLTAQNCDFTVKTLQTASTAAENSYLRGIYVAKGKSATLNGGTVTAQGNATYSKEGYGLYIEGSVDVDNCAVTVSDINTGAYAIYNSANTTKIGVASGKFKATATTTGVSTNGTAAAAKQQLYGGYYNTNTDLSKYLPAGYGIETLPSTSTEYGEGYRYAIHPTTDLGATVCKIGSTPYTTLEEALEYASKNATSSNKLTILMVANYTLKAGDYTLPQYTSLLIPMKDQTSIKTHPDRTYNVYTSPTCNIKLTFQSGVHMDVLGTIQTGSNQSAKSQLPGYNGMPSASYGWLYLESGSKITLENGSNLYAWGYVTGPGEIDAKRGSIVYEFIQIRDYRGGTATSSMSRAFPFNQFYIQNIESPITFRPGSKEICDGTVNTGTPAMAQTFNDVAFIGVDNSGSLFEMANEDMSEDTWVRKSYDAVHDKQVYELNSSVSLGSITVYGKNSADFVLPIPNNMHIHLLSGEMHIKENTEILPGAILEIDKEATAYINANKSLYFFDIADWNAFSTNIHTYPLTYSPSWAGSGKTCPRSQKITESAALNVHGTIVVNGKLYTTSQGTGANIYSSNSDAGTIKYGTAAPTTTATVYVNNTTSASSNTARTANPAWLQNEDGTHEETSGTAKDKSWIYYNGKWNCWEERNCFGYDNADHPYAKPAAWVQLTSDVADATDHLFRDAATGNRRFLLDECTWWEVEPTPYSGNKYKCVTSDHNGKYKYYEYVNNKWQEALVTITWKNGDATLATYSKTLYGTRPKYLEANPTKTKTTSEYYTWTGWTKGSTDGEFFAKDAELPVATENTTYYAYFETHKFEYTISFKNYDEAVLEAKRWAHGEVPTYEGTPLKPSTTAKEYTHDGWSTTKNGSKVTIPAATAAATYYAHFAESDRKYTIQWVNYDGTVLKEEQVAYNTTPTEPVTPTRPNDSYYTYTFDAWSPAISAVTGNQTYTATYNYEKKVTKYTINFKNGSTTLYSQSLPSGETPEYGGSTPTKDDAEYEYTFDGWSATDGGSKLVSLPTVSGDEDYFALFTHTPKRYTIRWKSEDGKVLYETDTNVPYGATPSYDGSTPTKARVGATVYTFDGWSATIGGNKIALPYVTGHATYYAHFSDDPVYTVTFDANEHGTAPSSQEVVENQHVIEPAAPAVAEWIFGGWYKEAECTNAWNFASDVVNANTTLYAKWTLAVATVTDAVGTTNYTTVASAISAANDKTDAVVKMLQNASVASEVEITAAMTIDLNDKTISSAVTTAATGVFKINASGKTVTITDSGTGGKISHKANCTGYLYGINLFAGSLNVEGGYIYAENTNPTAASGNRACGIMYANDYTNPASLTVSDGTIEAKRASTYVYGISIYTGYCGLTMTGGTVKASGSGTVRGIYTQGTAVLSNVTVTATAALTGTANCYAVFSDKDGKYTINSGTYTATSTSTGTKAYAIAVTKGTNDYPGGSVTINGGKFSGKNQEILVSNGTASLKGGYYVHNTESELEGKCATNYHVLPASLTEGGITYNHKVAEAYQITFNDYNGSLLQQSYQEKNITAAFTGETPTRAEDEDYTYTFSGWDAALGAVTANRTYIATYTSNERFYGPKLDIVDWTADYIIVNATNLRAYNGGTAWTIKYADANYTKANLATDRTVLIARDKAHESANGYAVIKLQGTAGVESRQKYTVPLIYDANATLSGAESNSIVYVHTGATLTVDANTTISKLYVSPGANVEITNGTLVVTDTLALRTLPWQSASINGNFTAGHTYYTRIGPDKNKTIAGLNGTTTYVPTVSYQFALPLSCSIAAVRLSDGTTPVYESTWSLKNYSESSRATNGAEENNWVFVPATGTIQASTGYEFFSNYKYYREYYFPVTLPVSATSVTVSRTGDDAANSGWNMICSPLMSNHQKNPQPEDIVVSWMNEEGGYDQLIPDIIRPAIPFFYQAKADNEQLSFAGSSVAPSLAPRRVAASEEQVRIQWIHLDVKDAEGNGDEASIYSHPTRYERTYKTGIDVAKQSLTASRAILYSSHVYGDMAFAGVADSLLEAGVALTVYSPSAQELTISMRENDWLNRLAEVWLIDHETGARMNLLDGNYTFDAAEGTTSGRFTIQGVFYAPQVATDIQNGQGEDAQGAKARKVIIEDKMYILLNGQMFDATGKMVNK